MSGVAFLPLQALLVANDLLISLLTFGWVNAVKKLTAKEPLRSVPLNDDDPSHRVEPNYVHARVTAPKNGVTTLYDLFQESVKDFADCVCMRKRHFIGWKSPKVKEFGEDITELTYAQVSEKIHKFGASLRAVGLVPSAPTTTLDKVETPCRIAIFENTCAEWMMCCLGAFSQAVGVATVYATLGIDAVMEAVNDNAITLIVCNKTNVQTLCDRKSSMPTLKVIVYTEDLIGKDDKTILPTPSDVKIYSFDEFVATGDVAKFPPTPPTPETTAVIMYTSGSTGKPKGVVIKHSATSAACASAEIVLNLEPKHKYLAYLPLAHIMEMMIEFVVLAGGASLNFADPKSLTATGSFPKGALEVYSPSHMLGVPKIWETIKKGILAKVALSSSLAQTLVHTAIAWRTIAVKYGLDTPLFNLLVFKKFKAAMGGNLIWALSGGGPLNAEVQDFIRIAFNLPLVQGYGLTENCAGLAVQAADDTRTGIAGAIIASMEVKVVSTPEVCDRKGAPYLSTDRVDVEGNKIWGRGEILCKGGNVTSGYYMMADKTKEVYSEDGWFSTGDIGQFMEDGSLRIVDRKKNLVKLKSGEYVALEKMEMVYGNSPFVDAIAGGICCYADGDTDRPVAMFQLNETFALEWAAKNGVEGDIEALKKSKELYDAVMKSFKEEHAKSDLSHIEKLQGLCMLTRHWTPENGCLTAANKLQRRVVIESFPEEFEKVKALGIFN